MAFNQGVNHFLSRIYISLARSHLTDRGVDLGRNLVLLLIDLLQLTLHFEQCSLIQIGIDCNLELGNRVQKKFKQIYLRLNVLTTLIWITTVKMTNKDL